MRNNPKYFFRILATPRRVPWGPIKKKKKNTVAHLAPRARSFFPFSLYNLSVNVPGLCWHVSHVTVPQNISCRVYILEYVCVRVLVYTHICIWAACRFFFYHRPTAPSITLHGRDAFSNRWWPTAALFSLSRPSSGICFPRFFSLFFTGAPIIRCSAFASVSYSFSTDRGRPLSSTASRRFFT